MRELLAVLRDSLRERYVVEREVGRGGMATVFLARDRKLGREVAIKVLSPGVMTAVAGERFLREIRITAQLQHPNILPLIDSGEAAGLLYSVMPFVDGCFSPGKWRRRSTTRTIAASSTATSNPRISFCPTVMPSSPTSASRARSAWPAATPSPLAASRSAPRPT